MWFYTLWGNFAPYYWFFEIDLRFFLAFQNSWIFLAFQIYRLSNFLTFARAYSLKSFKLFYCWFSSNGFNYDFAIELWLWSYPSKTFIHHNQFLVHFKKSKLHLDYIIISYSEYDAIIQADDVVNHEYHGDIGLVSDEIGRGKFVTVIWRKLDMNRMQGWYVMLRQKLNM